MSTAQASVLLQKPCSSRRNPSDSSYLSIFSFTYGSGVGVALSPSTNADRIIQFGLATATPAYRSPDDFTFRNFPSAKLKAEYPANAVRTRFDSSQVAIIRIENEYGVGSTRAFRQKFEELGGRIVIEESLPTEGSDFRSQVLRVKQKAPSLIYLAAYPAEGALLIRQARDLGRLLLPPT